MITKVFAMLAAGLASIGLHAQTVPQQVAFPNASGLSLNGLLYLPASPGPVPAVVVMHGSGGLWRDDNPAGGVMNPNFREWATNLTTAGYAALFVDSYTPRGLVEFRSKRPAENPALDDSACSPAYERPKDAHAALRYLRTLSAVDASRIGLIAFSQGAESALSAVLARNLDRPWTSSYLLVNGGSENRSMPSPPRLAPGEKGFAVAACFYPGCGFFGYYGSPSANTAGLYMPETPTLILHGGNDPLYKDNLYPEKLREKSRSEAVARNLSFNPLGLVVFAGAGHSFDESSLPANPAADDSDQAAKRAARSTVMNWLKTYLRDVPLQLSNGNQLAWPANSNTRYELGQSSDLRNWSYAPQPNDGISGQAEIPPVPEASGFFQLRVTGRELEKLP